MFLDFFVYKSILCEFVGINWLMLLKIELYLDGLNKLSMLE